MKKGTQSQFTCIDAPPQIDTLASPINIKTQKIKNYTCPFFASEIYTWQFFRARYFILQTLFPIAPRPEDTNRRNSRNKAGVL